MNGVDSCYSWVVAIASGVIFLLVSCPVRLGAQIFVSLLDRYDTSRKEASFPFVLAQVFRSVSGPFAGVLGERIGLQRVTILGCLLCSIGVGACFFAEDVIVISVCLGVINGIGYGWSSALVPEILNRHFKKHRNKAYGVFLSGGGLGSLIIPPILDLILKHFGVSGTFLILSAILLNSVPATMLLIIPKTEKSLTNMSPLLSLTIKNDASEKRQNFSDSLIKDMAISRTDRYEDLPENGKCPLDLISESETSIENFQTQLNDETVDDIKNHATDTKTSKEDICMDLHLNPDDKNDFLDESEASQSLLKKLIPDRFTSSGKNIDLHLNADDKKDFLDESEATQSLLKKLVPDRFTPTENNINLRNEKFNSSNESLLSKFSVLWSPEYLTIAVVQAVCIFINQIFWTIMVDFVRDKGIEQYLEVYFVMSLSLFDTIGRLLLGSIPDKGLMTIDQFCACSLVIVGLIFLLLAWLPEFYSMMAIISLMGFTFGGLTTMMPSIVTEFIMKEKRSIAMASRLLFSAPLCLIISPLIGFFRGSLGSYDGLLYVMAGMCAVCVMLVLLLPSLKKKRDRAQIKDND